MWSMSASRRAESTYVHCSLVDELSWNARASVQHPASNVAAGDSRVGSGQHVVADAGRGALLDSDLRKVF